MNSKQTLTLLANAAPPLLIGVGIFYAVKWLFAGEEEKDKPDKTAVNPVSAQRPSPIPPDSAWNSVANREIPAISGGKNPSPSPAPVSINTVKTAPQISVPTQFTFPAEKAAPEIPIRATRKIISRQDMANIFHRHTTGLTRKSAVAALTAMGFGKTAAYEAMAINGRFTSWLQFAPDGIITWKS